jgi:hypothetical protein
MVGGGHLHGNLVFRDPVRSVVDVFAVITY